MESSQPVLAEANIRLSQLSGKKINLTKAGLNVYDALYRQALALLNDETSAAKINSLWFTPEILRLSQPNYAAIEVFKRCQKLPHTSQCVITTRPPVCRQSTQESLEQYLPNVDWQKNLYIRQPDELSISGDDFKISCLKRLKINHIVEDSAATIAKIHSQLPNCQVTYLIQPWNVDDQSTHPSHSKVTFDDADEIYQHILESREKFLSS